MRYRVEVVVEEWGETRWHVIDRAGGRLVQPFTKKSDAEAYARARNSRWKREGRRAA